MKLAIVTTPLMVFALLTGESWGDTPGPVRIIFDTDMMGDVDDVGTAALLHALAATDEAEILAMGLSGKNPWSPLCLDALNTYPGTTLNKAGVSRTTRRNN